MGSYAHLLEKWNTHINYLKFCTDLFSIYLFNHSLGQPWTQIVHILGYKPTLHYFIAQMIPALAIGNSFSWLLSFDILPSSCLLLKYFLTFRHCKVLQASHLILFPAPVLKSAIPPRSPESFYWSGIRNQELGTRYAHCYQGIIISRLFQQIGIIIYFKE